MALALIFTLSFFLQGALGGIICENLPAELCAFSVSSSGKRCLLENYARKDGTVAYQCKTSRVNVNKMSNWVETEDCIKACGIDRKSMGISSDTLLQPRFLANLCSDSCYQSCPNVVDLYFNLALGEGMYLPSLCKEQRSKSRRLFENREGGVYSFPLSSAGPASIESIAPISGEDACPPSSV